MILAEPGWPALKRVVAEALDLPSDARDAHLAAKFPDPAQRAQATRLLRACELAAASPVLDLPAVEFVAPVLAEVEEEERGVPEALRTALTGRYTIERELGRGGMATVYLARDERHGRPVAIKLLRPELVPDDGPSRAAARFQREIEFAARLSHLHILPLYDSGAAGRLLYYITPYVDGETLRDRLRRTGRLPLPESLRLLRDVARALAHAHRQGVVHRDIKPANILLNQEGDALVADFGVARGLAAAQGPAGVTAAEHPDGAPVLEGPAGAAPPELTEGTLVLGTPAYMAPEQIRGGPGIDHRADLYAFGAVAYELLTGAAPFAGHPRHEQLAAHLSEVPEPVAARQPDVPKAVADLVDRLLAKRPDDRPRDATEVLRALDAAVADPSSRFQGSSRLARVGLERRLSRRSLVIGAAAVLFAAGGAELGRRMTAATSVPVSIAVLPFDALGDSAATHHLAVGMSDGIATDLAKLRAVVAPGYVTTSIYRGSPKSPQQIGTEQQVSAVLRGSVQQSEDRVRVDAQLLDADDGQRLWARGYERPSTELPEIQRDIMRATLATLRIRPSEGERDVLDRPATTDARAYDLYLQGRAIELAGQSRELWHPMPKDNIRRAQALYTRARDLDPRFALARARLALMHTLAAAAYDTTKARRDQARVEAETALRLQPGLPEAHEALASYWQLNGDLAKAIEELGLALEGFPHSADLRLALGGVLLDAGRFEEAAREYEHAARLEPGSPKGPFLAGMAYSRLRRREEAMRAFNRAIAAAPDYVPVKLIKGVAYLRWYGIPDTLLAMMESIPPDWDANGAATYARYTALWVQRRYADALAMLDRSRSELYRDDYMYQPKSLMRARLYESMGEQGLAQASYATALSVIQDSVAANPSAPNMRIALGLAYAGLGRRAEALREARRAMELVPVSSSTVDATGFMGGAVEVFAAAGEIDASLDLLELLFSMPAGREATVPFLRVWPGFDPLRGDPRFEELLVRFTAER
ncbi:MAG TPA: protein kinase [Methylomirabilota bacterium]